MPGVPGMPSDWWAQNADLIPKLQGVNPQDPAEAAARAAFPSQAAGRAALMSQLNQMAGGQVASPASAPFDHRMTLQTGDQLPINADYMKSPAGDLQLRRISGGGIGPADGGAFKNQSQIDQAMSYVEQSGMGGRSGLMPFGEPDIQSAMRIMNPLQGQLRADAMLPHEARAAAMGMLGEQANQAQRYGSAAEVARIQSQPGMAHAFNQAQSDAYGHSLAGQIERGAAAQFEANMNNGMAPDEAIRSLKAMMDAKRAVGGLPSGPNFAANPYLSGAQHLAPPSPVYLPGAAPGQSRPTDRYLPTDMSPDAVRSRKDAAALLSPTGLAESLPPGVYAQLARQATGKMIPGPKGQMAEMVNPDMEEAMRQIYNLHLAGGLGGPLSVADLHRKLMTQYGPPRVDEYMRGNPTVSAVDAGWNKITGGLNKFLGQHAAQAWFQREMGVKPEVQWWEPNPPR
jgi:hypothetical protein